MDSSNIRRRLNRSSESSPYLTTPTLDQDLAATVHLLDLLESVEGPEVKTTADRSNSSIQRDLNRMLSLHSEVSTTSSAAMRHNAAQEREDIVFRKIGAGSCGAVFAQDGKSVVVKLAKTDGNHILWNDYLMHSLIRENFSKYEVTEIRIPDCYYFVPKDNTNFFSNHPSLVKAASEVCHVPSSALISERIMPLPHDVRANLIQEYCAPRNKDKALLDPANKDCLVRTYLGSSHGKSGALFFSLRNFKLHLNQLVELDLDVEAMAHRMAVAMAVMHWAALTDARDIEFVLGSTTKKVRQLQYHEIQSLAPYSYTGPPSNRLEDFGKRTTELWVLDFNLVRSITLDEAGVAQAVEAARLNDPYLPKPLQTSKVAKKVWNEFVRTYLDTSSFILEREKRSPDSFRLPRMFLHGLVEAEKERRQKSEYVD